MAERIVPKNSDDDLPFEIVTVKQNELAVRGMAQELPPAVAAARTTLGGNQDRMYMMKFALVDGDHVAGVVSHPSVVKDHVKVLIETHNQAFPDNPMTGWGGEGKPTLQLATRETIDRAVREMNTNSPDRIGAENQFAVPNKILHVGRDAHLERLGQSVQGGTPPDAPNDDEIEREPTFGG